MTRRVSETIKSTTEDSETRHRRDIAARARGAASEGRIASISQHGFGGVPVARTRVRARTAPKDVRRRRPTKHLPRRRSTLSSTTSDYGAVSDPPVRAGSRDIGRASARHPGARARHVAPGRRSRPPRAVRLRQRGARGRRGSRRARFDRDDPRRGVAQGLGWLALDDAAAADATSAFAALVGAPTPACPTPPTPRCFVTARRSSPCLARAPPTPRPCARRPAPRRRAPSPPVPSPRSLAPTRASPSPSTSAATTPTPPATTARHPSRARTSSPPPSRDSRTRAPTPPSRLPPRTSTPPTPSSSSRSGADRPATSPTPRTPPREGS